MEDLKFQSGFSALLSFKCQTSASPFAALRHLPLVVNEIYLEFLDAVEVSQRLRSVSADLGNKGFLILQLLLPMKWRTWVP